MKATHQHVTCMLQEGQLTSMAVWLIHAKQALEVWEQRVQKTWHNMGRYLWWPDLVRLRNEWGVFDTNATGWNATFICYQFIPVWNVEPVVIQQTSKTWKHRCKLISKLLKRPLHLVQHERLSSHIVHLWLDLVRTACSAATRLCAGQTRTKPCSSCTSCTGLHTKHSLSFLTLSPSPCFNL